MERRRLDASRVAEPSRGGPDLPLGVEPLPQIPSDRVPRHPDRTSNCLAAEAAIRECTNREHHLAFDHRHLLGRRYQVPRLRRRSTRTA
jgi:hypothetical protein